MLHKISGIVLNTINYSDKYILATLYTDLFGRTTYMVPKGKSKASKVQRSIFSPLAILELEVDHQNKRDVHRIKEVHIQYPLYSISGNMVKTSIAFFLSEFLSRILKDSDEHELIYRYLNQSILVLEETKNGLANFHLVFILKLSKFLGFYPNFENYQQNDYFDMLNGIFVYNQPLHNHYINRIESNSLALLSRINYENMHLFEFSRQDRINIINRMLEYYRIHLSNFQELKSLDILHELF